MRERTEEIERASLSTWGTLAAESKGRDVAEPPDPLRTAFQTDRDRILDSTAFRRLKHKSHLLLGDGHRRMRATHALEVGQIARTLGRGLRLNEDLIEAIALGHDVGSTAFAGAGEEVLRSLTDGGFRHEEQSLRVVEQLEADGRGLNLTWEVRDGIVHHCDTAAAPATLEGQAVRMADRLAAATHDLREAARVGIVAADDLPAAVTATLGNSFEERLSTLIRDVITESVDHPELRMSARVESALADLVNLFRDAVAASPKIAAERNRAVHCLGSLAIYLQQHVETLPETSEDPTVRICDAVAALTDGQALSEFQRLLLPGS